MALIKNTYQLGEILDYLQVNQSILENSHILDTYYTDFYLDDIIESLYSVLIDGETPKEQN